MVTIFLFFYYSPTDPNGIKYIHKKGTYIKKHKVHEFTVHEFIILCWYLM